jgi:hypothetical protein
LTVYDPRRYFFIGGGTGRREITAVPRWSRGKSVAFAAQRWGLGVVRVEFNK